MPGFFLARPRSLAMEGTRRESREARKIFQSVEKKIRSPFYSSSWSCKLNCFIAMYMFGLLYAVSGVLREYCHSDGEPSPFVKSQR